MTTINVHTYFMVKKRRRLAILGGGWLIFLTTLSAWLGQGSVFFWMVFAVGLTVGLYIMYFAFITHIVLSPKGIQFRAPFFSIQCEWKDIEGFKISKREIYISPGRNVQITTPYKLGWLFQTRENQIPLHPFLDAYPERESGLGNGIIEDIAEYAPFLVETIIKS